MELYSKGDFYIGIEDVKYCELSLHLGNLLVEYRCPKSRNNDTRSMEAVNRPDDVKVTNGNGDSSQS